MAEDEVDDGAPKSIDNDISRKRLNSLKSFIKYILLSKESGNTEDLVKDSLQ